MATYVKAINFLITENKRLKNEINHQFSKGYTCAVANLIQMYGDSSEAEELYNQNFLSLNELKKIGVEQRDIELLTPSIKELERRKKINI